MRASFVCLVMLAGVAVAFVEPPTIPQPPPLRNRVYVPDIPEGSRAYRGAVHTQSISILDERDVIRRVPILSLSDKRWHQPGGMLGIKGWRVEKFRYLPTGTKVKSWIGNIGVKNSFGFVQQNRGILRSYPDGTRFDEVLRNSTTDRVFEHRVRQKKDGKWLSTVEFKDETERPDGYDGLKVSCSSCHKECGTGAYAEGLVPGGDETFSDPLEWSLVR